ncbi:hypothetical protein HPP92_004993 [Vanilla planifolia]|uniref:Uncharacterized protein n=1 Tax=Vanilla planifolia TaxID=51239 RepID=A0A835RLX9_VANPL|nr:hypothetical protein HPP92_004993 [Vanilla planifolia]
MGCTEPSSFFAIQVGSLVRKKKKKKTIKYNSDLCRYFPLALSSYTSSAKVTRVPFSHFKSRSTPSLHPSQSSPNTLSLSPDKMPKSRRSRSVSVDRRSPFPCRSLKRRRYSPPATPAPATASSSSRNPPRSPALVTKGVKEWDDVRCAVCMEHPHNAVLLICASHDKGCRPFMCDTSYRHSNCLDQYRKSCDAAAVESAESKDKLSCPLCRGIVSGWKVVDSARKYMNAKSRSCSTESCGFAGAYCELRKHARMVHPLVRPSEADPERQKDWRRMEQQRDLGDLFSTMQSAFGGDDEGLGFVGGDEAVGNYLSFPSFTFLLVLRLQGSGRLSGSRRSSGRRGSSRSTRSHRGRAVSHWGESIRDTEASLTLLSGTADDGYIDYGYEEDVEDGNSADGHHGGEEVHGFSRRRRGHGEMRTIEDDEDGGVL